MLKSSKFSKVYNKHKVTTSTIIAQYKIHYAIQIGFVLHSKERYTIIIHFDLTGYVH